MSAGRITAARVAELAPSVTARDWLILATLRLVRVATAQQGPAAVLPREHPAVRRSHGPAQWAASRFPDTGLLLLTRRCGC